MGLATLVSDPCKAWLSTSTQEVTLGFLSNQSADHRVTVSSRWFWIELGVGTDHTSPDPKIRSGCIAKLRPSLEELTHAIIIVFALCKVPSMPVALYSFFFIEWLVVHCSDFRAYNPTFDSGKQRHEVVRELTGIQGENIRDAWGEGFPKRPEKGSFLPRISPAWLRWTRFWDI